MAESAPASDIRGSPVSNLRMVLSACRRISTVSAVGVNPDKNMPALLADLQSNDANPLISRVSEKSTRLMSRSGWICVFAMAQCECGRVFRVSRNGLRESFWLFRLVSR